MISKLVGTILKKNTKTKVWWMKLGFCLILSNVFFFILFGGSSNAEVESKDPYEGLIDVQVVATLLTPFQEGKKILIVNRAARVRIEGVLKKHEEGETIVAVTENGALSILAHGQWEILPFLKDFQFRQYSRGENFEIRY